MQTSPANHASAPVPDLSELSSLEKILTWMSRHGVDGNLLDVIAQDEYCHDLILPWQGSWFVFGLT